MSKKNKARAEREARARHKVDPTKTYQQHLAQIRLERAARAGQPSPVAPAAPQPRAALSEQTVDSTGLWATCPSCSSPRLYSIGVSGFLPGTECGSCGAVEWDLEYEADDDGWLVTMDSDGTVRYMDRWGNTEYVGTLDDEDWERWAAPLNVERDAVAAAVRLRGLSPEYAAPADLWDEATFLEVVTLLGLDNDVDDEGGHACHYVVHNPDAVGDESTVEYRVEVLDWDDPASGLFIRAFDPRTPHTLEPIPGAEIHHSMRLTQEQVHSLLFQPVADLEQFAADAFGSLDVLNLTCARCGDAVSIHDGALAHDGWFVCQDYVGHDEHGTFAPTHVLTDEARDADDREWDIHDDAAAAECSACRAAKDPVVPDGAAGDQTTIVWPTDGLFLQRDENEGNAGCDRCGPDVEAVVWVDGAYLCAYHAQKRGLVSVTVTPTA